MAVSSSPHQFTAEDFAKRMQRAGRAGRGGRADRRPCDTGARSRVPGRVRPRGHHGAAHGAHPPNQGRPEDEVPRKRRNPWIWISVVLGLVAVGLLVWALTTQSDLDNAEQEADAAQSQLEHGKLVGQRRPRRRGRPRTTTSLRQLGASTEDLEATQRDLEDAQNKSDQAKQDAAAAEQDAAKANNDADRAKAETEKAQAEAEAADSKAAIAADCAKAYVSALGTLFEGESVSAQAEVVKQQLESISATCKASLEGA